jgi:hypothetical protein
MEAGGIPLAMAGPKGKAKSREYGPDRMKSRYPYPSHYPLSFVIFYRESFDNE